MRKFLVVLFCFIFFWFSYQIRIGFVATGDYNEPSDWHEYLHAIPSAQWFLSFADKQEWLIRHNTVAVNSHGTPLYIIFLAYLHNRGVTPQQIAPAAGAGLVMLLFSVSLRFFPLWIAVLVGIAASVYTPLFAFIYSYMPENLTPVVVPAFVIAASTIVCRARRSGWFVGAGLLLFLMGFWRHVFAYYGILFIVLWILTSPGKTKAQVIGLVAGYLIPTIAWQLWIWRFGGVVYGEGAIQSSLVVEHRLVTDGWGMDGIKGLTWLDVIQRVIIHQNPLSLVFLEIERIGRFLKNPANSYSTCFPLSCEALRYVHAALLFFAVWGLRFALRYKFLTLIASVFIWNTLFVSAYYVEELRYQMPVLGVFLLLAGAGLAEMQHLMRYRHLRPAIGVAVLLSIVWFAARQEIAGIEQWVFPAILDSRFWKAFHILVTLGFMFYLYRRLRTIHEKAKHSVLFSCIPALFFLFGIVPYARSRIWHEWRAPIRAGMALQQEIVLDSAQVDALRDKSGYLLVDVEDVNAGQFIKISINGVVVPDRVPLGKRMSPVDIMAIRQWQRLLPRLGGFAAVEDELQMAPTWPGLHEWLVLPVSGQLLREVNVVSVENNVMVSSDAAYLYGDYLPFGSAIYYEGPTPRLFQGPRTHNKYQVEQDMRLHEILPLRSKMNQSMVLSAGKIQSNDLSAIVGTQSGRYRIFFLFPFDGKDPVDIF